MPQTVTGSAAGFNPAVTYTLKAPVDGDSVNADSVTDGSTVPITGFQSLADLGEFVRTLTAILNQVNSFSARQHLDAGWLNATSPTHVWEFIGGGVNGPTPWSMYGGSAKVCITVNADWNDTTQLWSSTTHGTASTRFYLDTGSLTQQYHGATAGTWAEGGWTTQSTIDLTSGALNLAGLLTVAAGIQTTSGNDMTSGGNVVASGTPVGSAGPGLAKASRIYSTGTALGSSDFVLHANWGVGAGKSVSSGSTDTAGQITVTAAGVPGANPTVKLTFTNGTWTNTPFVQWFLTDGTGVDLSWGTTQTDTTVTFKGTPVAATQYTFGWIVTGY